MKYSIGLDCGIASVGYAVMQLDENDEPCRIIDLGSRIFTKAENPKDGASLALPRREARGARRRRRRHRHRLDRIRYLIVQNNILDQDELDNLFSGQLSDIYMLRTKALDEPLSDKEFARVLINLAQRRGFKSNRKSDAKDKEAGKLLKAVSENQKLMETAGYRTVGEMLFKDEKYREYKRNKGEDYKNTVMRDMIEDEIHKIFIYQRAFGMIFATEEIEKDYTDIVMSQRPFDLGPGEGNANSPSIYAGDQIAKMIGKCTLFPEEQRAAKGTYSFQIFTLWQNINNIKIASLDGIVRPLNDFERTEIFQLCHKTKDVNYLKIRKVLNLSDDSFFKNLSYGTKEKADVE
ncbi:MAG: type II CRISPR RNA-guided endonuclease Cas9, partial [Candidatus Fimenecus sp.]